MRTVGYRSGTEQYINRRAKPIFFRPSTQNKSILFYQQVLIGPCNINITCFNGSAIYSHLARHISCLNRCTTKSPMPFRDRCKTMQYATSNPFSKWRTISVSASSPPAGVPITIINVGCLINFSWSNYAGIYISKLAPLPNFPLAVIIPLWFSTIFFTMASPIPVPG